MKRFKPVRNRSNKRLKRIHRTLENEISLVGHSVKDNVVIGGTIIKKPVMNAKAKKEDETVLSTYKETGLYSMVEAEGNQLT